MNSTKMSEAALEARRRYNREYARKWRREHPERAKEIQARYWTRRAEREMKGGVTGGGNNE